MSRLEIAGVIAGCAAILACSLAADASATLYSNARVRAEGTVYYSNASWNAARATIEIRSGSLSDSDARNGGFVLNSL